MRGSDAFKVSSMSNSASLLVQEELKHKTKHIVQTHLYREQWSTLHWCLLQFDAGYDENAVSPCLVDDAAYVISV